MWPAQIIARSVAPSSPVALRCSAPGCVTCATFETEEREDYEGTHLRGVTIVPWGCDDEARSRLAVSLGVTRLPAYIVVRDATVRVLQP